MPFVIRWGMGKQNVFAIMIRPIALMIHHLQSTAIAFRFRATLKVDG
jgi:hypothetical protein